MIAALIAQGLSLEDAACAGVCLHAVAGDAAATKRIDRFIDLGQLNGDP
jgi:NAD(P)H-hydrate repair Nnr-like enzyme with NAD(P)H-hydrate dehydratase domain